MMPRLFSRLCRHALVLGLAAGVSISLPAAGTEPSVITSPASRYEREGVAIDFSLLTTETAASTKLVAPKAGETARVRFKVTDTTTGQPVRRLHPAAWLSRRSSLPGARPRTCAEKVQELLGGSIFSKADLDLNNFQVLALNDDATITVVDPLFGFGGTKLLAMVPLPGVGADWALTADNARLLVSVPSAGKIAVIDTATWKISALLEPGPAPSHLNVQPDAHYAWVACERIGEGGSGGVAAIATDGSSVVARIATGAGAGEIVFSADSHWAFVVNRGAQTLSVIDVRTLKKTKDIALSCQPAAMAYSPLSEAVYLTDEAGGKIVVVDAVKHEIVARIAAEPGVGRVKFTPGARYGLVAVPAHDLVLVLDAANNRIVQRARIEGAPDQFAFTSDMAFVMRRHTATVGMIPLKEIGREGQPVPVADFTGGEKPFGARNSLADAMVAAPGETAVVVANPGDKAIYYYMEGMAAPMGNFGNYDRKPRAALVLDRSLREVSPGVYETAAELPAAGDYDAVFFLDSPRVTHCFSAQIQPNPTRQGGKSPTARLEPLTRPTLVANVPAQVGFRLVLNSATAVTSLAVPQELTIMAVLAPGTWHQREKIAVAKDGTLAFAFTPPKPGIYYFYAESPELGLALNSAPSLVLRVADPVPAAK